MAIEIVGGSVAKSQKYGKPTLYTGLTAKQ